jgi:hypothetical protein
VSNGCDLTPPQVCLRVPRQTDSVWEFVLGDALGRPVDIAGSQVEFLVLDKPGGTIKLDLINDITDHLDETNGTTEFEIDHHAFDAETSTDDRMWVFELWRIRPSGKQSLHLAGNFILEAVLKEPHVHP